MNHPLILRLATIKDLNKTFEWASNATVRQYAIQKEVIILKNHNKWFSEKIISSDCVYFIAKVNKKRIGSIRFDISENKEALLSFLLEPESHGKGYAKKNIV
jgi:RimJ/RimL family protein N-acetyltransferase